MLKDFENPEPLGRGGFGSVVKATHRVDRVVYAIKRIHLDKDPDMNVKIRREVHGGGQGHAAMISKWIRYVWANIRSYRPMQVHILSELFHPRVVRYYSAWLEGSEHDGDTFSMAMGDGSSDDVSGAG